ncbi:hypothetical protein [Nonomuraea sp. NPDC049141]|uniref:hypothetical protein n=1 Tax=Nonomuraea sp. NPDC049141 TaxID=3155500 RepID=UPI0033FED2BF
MRPLPLPLLIQLMIGPMAGHMLPRPALTAAPGDILPPVEVVAATFAEAFIRATTHPDHARETGTLRGH